MRYGRIWLLLGVGLFSFYAVYAINRRDYKKNSKPMELTSSAFKDGDKIPVEYTCDSVETVISPPLTWLNAPAETRSFVLTCVDIDAPHGKFVHWIVFNIPATTTSFLENARIAEMGIMQGLNGWHKLGYGGMCPLLGRHRYVFKIYALDTLLVDLDSRAKYSNILNSIHGHILASASLMGWYEKSVVRKTSIEVGD